MNINDFLKAVIDSDSAPVVICNLDHIIVYMNPAAKNRYHADLCGKSLKDCHKPESNEKIERVVNWFKESPNNNTVFTYHSEKDNKDLYMIALRDSLGNLLGYYEKHESRAPESKKLYEMD